VVTRPRTRPRIFALWFALFAFVVVSLLPWLVVSIDPPAPGRSSSAPASGNLILFVVSPRRGSLWAALARVLGELEERGATWELLRPHLDIPLFTLVAVAAGYGLGRLLYWLAWERRPPVPPGPR
jgi:hypothetical protein